MGEGAGRGAFTLLLFLFFVGNGNSMKFHCQETVQNLPATGGLAEEGCREGGLLSGDNRP